MIRYAHPNFYRGWAVRPDYRPGREPDAYRADRLGVTLCGPTRSALHVKIDTRKRNDPPTRGPETRTQP